MALPTHSPSPGDGEFLAGLQSGDGPAVVRLYETWGAFVYSLALTVTGAPEVAAEITYEVFMFVWADPNEANLADGTVRARLAALTHARAVGVVRDRCAEQSARGSAHPPITGGEWADRGHLAQAVAKSSGASGAASVLPPQQRLALTLTYLAGHTIRDTARILGLSRPTVLAQLTAGLYALSPK